MVTGEEASSATRAETLYFVNVSPSGRQKLSDLLKESLRLEAKKQVSL